MATGSSLPIASSIHIDRNGAALLSVYVQPGASRDEIVGLHVAALKVRVTAPPEGGRANQATAVVLAEALGLPVRHVELVSGGQNRQKRFRISALTPDELAQRLSTQLPRS